MAALAPFPTRLAPNGMVCAVDHLAAGAGVAMLRAGGSAADAAIAASAVLAVTCQHLCGLGGDLFALVHVDGDERPHALNASGRAGSGADPDRLRAAGHRTMPMRGDIAAAPVPGCVDGWLALHERFGRLPLADIIEPARRLASDGFPASELLALATLVLGHDLAGADDFVGSGPLQTGQTVSRPGVARTLDAIAAAGREAFYLGEFGAGLLDIGAGEYVEDDLRTPLADWVEPLVVDAWDRRLWTVPPNSQGYLTLAGAWIAAGLQLPQPEDAGWAHLLIEAARQAAFDRTEVLHEGADGAALLDVGRLASRREAIDVERAADLGRAPIAAGDTIFLCAVDGDGMGVSLIQSNASGWGAHIVEPRTGIFLHDRGIGFSLEPGHPAEYGPGRRPPHTLSPAVVTRHDGSLDMVIGTMGGDSQPQVLLQLLARLLVAGEGPGDAIAAGRWTLAPRRRGTGFDTWAERGAVQVRVEGHAPPPWDEGLRARGHVVERGGAFGHDFGHAHAIRVEGDHLAGASDPRAGAGDAVGY